MWKIEGENIEKGGRIQWSHQVRFRNLRNSKYLTINTDIMDDINLDSNDD